MTAGRLMPWLRLVRVPNLFTVPGDPILGYALCGGDFSRAEPYLVAAVSTLVYIFGLVTNDIADIEVDRKERPGRPLPSGQVHPTDAAVLACLCLAASAALAALSGQGRPFYVLMAALCAAVLVYNFGLKRSRLLGPMLLGLCRTLSILLGAVAADRMLFGCNPLLLLAVISAAFFYVYGVSLAASGEMEPGRRPLSLAGPFLIIGASAAMWPVSAFASISSVLRILDEIPPVVYLALALSLANLAVVAFVMFNRIRKGGAVGLDGDIGTMIRGLVLFQASGLAFAGDMTAALAVLALYVPAWFSGRFFYGS